MQTHNFRQVQQNLVEYWLSGYILLWEVSTVTAGVVEIGNIIILYILSDYSCEIFRGPTTFLTVGLRKPFQLFYLKYACQYYSMTVQWGGVWGFRKMFYEFKGGPHKFSVPSRGA